MTSGSDHTADVTNTMWSSPDVEASDLDEDCNPNKVCRNAKAISFDGFAEEGGDVKAAWRETLAREGKLNTSTESVRDLVLGPPTSS
jgi:hypothetical protein